MPTYEFKCHSCLSTYDAFRTVLQRNDAPECPTCGGPTQRIIGRVNFARSTVQSEPHFNHVLGQVVSSTKDFEEKLHKMNEENGTHYVVADPNDPSVHATDDGMYETEKAKTDSGEREGTRWLL